MSIKLTRNDFLELLESQEVELLNFMEKVFENCNFRNDEDRNLKDDVIHELRLRSCSAMNQWGKLVNDDEPKKFTKKQKV